MIMMMMIMMIMMVVVIRGIAEFLWLGGPGFRRSGDGSPPAGSWGDPQWEFGGEAPQSKI